MISWWQMSLKFHHYYNQISSLKEELLILGTVKVLEEKEDIHFHGEIKLLFNFCALWWNSVRVPCGSLPWLSSAKLSWRGQYGSLMGHPPIPCHWDHVTSWACTISRQGWEASTSEDVGSLGKKKKSTVSS